MTTENNTGDQSAATHAAAFDQWDDVQDAVPNAPAAIAPAYSDPDFAARYGVRPRMSRARKITLGVFGFLVLCGVAGYIAWNEANPATQATVVSYTVDGSSINVTFEVDKSAGQSVDCTLEAEDVNGNVIGSANVLVPRGRAKTDMVYTVNTTGTPNTAVVSSCTSAS